MNVAAVSCVDCNILMKYKIKLVNTDLGINRN